MTVNNIAGKASSLGIDIVAVTDHLMKPNDIENLKITRNDINNFKSSGHAKNVLFGVEVCEVSGDGSTLLNQKLVEEMQFDVIIGGIHETHVPAGSSLKDVALMQHRHHLFMMENPLIEILVHPWWLDKNEFKKLNIAWPVDMSFIPEVLTIELAHASLRTHTYIEISTMSGLCNRDTSPKFKRDLVEYYRLLHHEGALFAIGSDAHELSDISTFQIGVDLIKQIGIGADRMWQPKTDIK
jgi:histidinol phosphatase-like PHP family hydrolase